MKNWIEYQRYAVEAVHANQQGNAYVITQPEKGGEDAAAKVRAVAEEIAGVRFVPVKPPFGFNQQ